MSDAKQTPLIDLLRGVPESARALREVNEHQHQNVPYGRLMNEAADEIEALKAERDALKDERDLLKDKLVCVIGEHRAPNDCYSTGPFSNTAMDFICPSCDALKTLTHLDAARSNT